MLNANDIKNNAKLSFYRENDLIFRFDDYIYESHRLCIL